MRWPHLIVRIALLGAMATGWFTATSPAWAEAPKEDLPVSPQAALPTASPISGQAPASVPVLAEQADGAGEGDDSEPPTPGARARLDRAVRSYQLGKRQEARDLLVALVSDTELDDPEIRQQARVYLGELLYVSDDEEGARRFFELVLDEDPGFVIDPFRHPPDVCGYFNYVRSYKVPLSSITSPLLLPSAPRRAPGSAWAPFGAYHFAQGAPLRGSLYALGGTVAASTSLLMFYRLWGDRTWRDGDEVELARLQRLRLVQYSATFGFYGIWGMSVIDAHAHWKRHQDAARTLAPTPVIEVSGRF